MKLTVPALFAYYLQQSFMKKNSPTWVLVTMLAIAAMPGGVSAQQRSKKTLTAEQSTARSSKSDSQTPSLESLQSSARAGDAEARYMLGNIYLTGEGDPRGPQVQSAIACLHLASEQGHAGARDELAKLKREMPTYTKSVIASMETRVNNFMTQGEWARSSVKAASCE